MSKERSPITNNTISALADELANVDINNKELASRADAMENLISSIATLRSVNLKDVEPAVIFQPLDEEEGGER